MNDRHWLSARRVIGAALLACALVVGSAVAAGAVRPAPGTTDTQGNFEFSDVQGYTAAGPGANCGAYSPGATFSVNFNVFNNGPAAADQSFTLQLWKMTQLDSNTCLTEAALEAMVHNGVNSAQTKAVQVDTTSYHFADRSAPSGASQRVTASSATPSACAYYQFDVALSGSAEHTVPPVSGFILVRGCAAASPTASPTGSAAAATATVSSSTAGAQTARLATTGGGTLAVAPYLVLIVLGVIGLLSGGWMLRPRRRSGGSA